MRSKPIFISMLFAILGIGVVFATHALATHYLGNSAAPGKVSCPGTKVSHHITIDHDRVSTPQLQAKLCDTLTITNNDDKLRQMAFGVHDHHQTYDNTTEKVLKKGQSLSVTLNQIGTTTYHDHLQDEVRGEFTVGK